MLIDALLAYLHYLAIFLTAFFLMLEWVRCREPVEARRARVLFRVDLGYFLSALAALATGLLRVFHGAKGPAFYLSNPVFHAKLGAYILIAVLSVPVTLAFRRWNRALRGDEVSVPAREIRRVRALLLAQILLLALLPALAVLMARGVRF
jgi:putative membrane protein